MAYPARVRVALPLATLLVACSFTQGELPTKGSPDAHLIDVVKHERVTKNLIGLWTFGDARGDSVADSVQLVEPSFAKPPMNLTISPAANAEWVPGGLRIKERLAITSPQTPQAHICRDIMASDAFTLEFWVTPADDVQGTDDYAVIFTLSANYAYRNLTLAQVGDHFIARVLTTETVTSAGLSPELMSAPGTVTSAPIHLVVVADSTGRTLYVNGAAHVSTPLAAGSLSVWKDNYRISMADEMLSDHHWTGTLWFAATYDRALSEQEVRQNYAAGHDCTDC